MEERYLNKQHGGRPGNKDATRGKNIVGWCVCCGYSRMAASCFLALHVLNHCLQYSEMARLVYNCTYFGNIQDHVFVLERELITQKRVYFTVGINKT